MTINTEAITAGPLEGNGVNSEFSYAFKVFVDSDVAVWHTDILGNTTRAVLNSNYIVTRNADQDNNPGGTIIWRVGGITTALPAGEKITITSALPFTQTTSLPSGGKYAAKTLERMVDKVTILVKQLWRATQRSLRQPLTDANDFIELPGASVRRGKFLFFDDTPEAQPGVASTINTAVVPVTAFMQTVLDDPNAAAARATLGALGGTMGTFGAVVLATDTPEEAVLALEVLTDAAPEAPGPAAIVGDDTAAARADHVHPYQVESIIVAASDMATNISSGTGKVSFRMPYAFTLTELPRAALATAQPSGAIFTVDINENGVSILSTKLTIDNTEKTSTTAATPAVVSDANLANDAEITVDVDVVGAAGAKGLTIALIGRRTS